MKKNNKNNLSKFKQILDLISEAGMLKRVVRSGWTVLGVPNPESVAEHSFRCAVIGYCLAKTEGADPYKVLMMALFGDIQESRTSDLHKMAQRYLDAQEFEDRAYCEQIRSLPAAIKDELFFMRENYRSQKSKESIIARDADILECLIQAREYYEQGHKQAVKFTKKAPNFLKTKSAIKLWKLAKISDLNIWWLKLSDFRR
ncbi:MAG: HD domain-containing protein [Candidatus Omnitrophica bacterium]|nr:HD domain-containing protein [Candidatus Omnitrophota bacterium]